jgi:tRNA 2-selenouridine synthase
VWVESESRKVGNLRVPEALIQRMRENGRCLNVEMPDSGRLALLLQDYDFFARDVELFCRQLDCLLTLRGRETVHAWQAAARAGRIAEVFLELMHVHYDPGYLKSMKANFAGFEGARVVELADGEGATLKRAANELLAEETA